MTYSEPSQVRAIETEKRFLSAFKQLLQEKAFGTTTIDEIAQRAGLHRGAFLKRFGSKKSALFVLYEAYVRKASAVIGSITARLPYIATAYEVCNQMSRELERIQKEDFSANRAMHEMFLEKLQTDPSTKRIFMETVALMRATQERFLADQPFTDVGAFAATQLLVTINYNFVLKAMPALPRDDDVRHQLIADCLVRALKI